ncbi:hypothetical protein AAFF_G00372470 [Aldrovandia affinis]|uniref:Coiled-coil domain-containing protein 152 n=1 Tax=Aldrovandia affinis TaxID=143900 RepID=A0AAD7WM69_9TELE|nr:hypothetical protein AAFF_G00372470 [Aldrovandia affinis]
MTSRSVNLEKLIEDFSQLEQKMSDLKGKNNLLEMRLDETGRVMTLNQTKEKYLREERDELLQAVNGLQHTIQQQCELSVENKTLKNSICDLERQKNAKLQDSAARMERWRSEMAVQTAEHQREMAEVRGQLQDKLEGKVLEMEEAMQRKESELEQMRKRMKEQERQKQTEIIRLQMEFSGKLARAQSISVKAQQPVGSCPLPQNIYKRKLQFIQEERQKEVDALQQRVKELEQQNSNSFTDFRLKRRKL